MGLTLTLRKQSLYRLKTACQGTAEILIGFLAYNDSQCFLMRIRRKESYKNHRKVIGYANNTPRSVYLPTAHLSYISIYPLTWRNHFHLLTRILASRDQEEILYRTKFATPKFLFGMWIILSIKQSKSRVSGSI